MSHIAMFRQMLLVAWFEDHATFVQFVLFDLSVDAGALSLV